MKPKPYMLCPARHTKAKSGVVVCCERTGHACDPATRTPYLWDARDNDGNQFKSISPHCGSCASDEEYYGLRDTDERCCCLHGERQGEFTP